MGVICLASLKGGVGKTALAVNVAHSFACRGCRTLLVDLDPGAHTSRLLSAECGQVSLARIFLEPGRNGKKREEQLVRSVRTDLDLLPASAELRHFFASRGGAVFARCFAPLIAEFREVYDHIVFDTPPDFNILTRNALAVSDIAAMPVDASEMSIQSLEALIVSAQHIKRPLWAIVRTMVNRKAARTNAFSSARLQERLIVPRRERRAVEDFDVEDPEDFMELLREWERRNRAPSVQPMNRDARPIYLLRSLIYRTEAQNQLSFLRRTALDSRSTRTLAEQYLHVASELEALIAAREDEPALETASPLALLVPQNNRQTEESEDALDLADRSVSLSGL